ncbi:MAG: hypothetical protein QXP98_00015 [Thermoproteus sp.]
MLAPRLGLVFFLLLAASALAYSVFWGEFVHCDVGSCLYPNPDGRFLSISQSSVVFDTRGDPSAMGFYVVAVELTRHTQLNISGWWSYSLPRTMAYVVSDKGFSALECSTGGGADLSRLWPPFSGRLLPRVGRRLGPADGPRGGRRPH